MALNVASLGAKASLVAAVGMDAMAGVLRQKLESGAIRCKFVEYSGAPTTTKIRIVSRNQQMVRADIETPYPVDVNAIIEQIDAIGDFDNMILSDYDKGVLKDPEAIIAYALKRRIPCLVDPKFKSFSQYRGATLIKPNKLELEHAVGVWTSELDMVNRCRQLMAAISVEAMLVTRASEGMTLILKDGQEAHFPARTREVYDPSGAGDTVIAVVAAALAAGQTLKDAVALSNIAAGIVVSHFGVTSVSGPELRSEVDIEEPLDKGKMTAEQLQIAVRVARSRGERIVFTNGCFDILHAGHVDYLQDARKEGDRLIVAVNSDESVRRLKGEGRPINTIDRRMTMLAGLSSVDWVVPFHEDTPEVLIKSLEPDVLVKGGDYAIEQVVGAEIVRAYNGEVKVLKLVEDCSTSALVEKIRGL